MSEGIDMDSVGRVSIYQATGGDGGNHPVATGWRGTIIHDEQLGLHRCFTWSATDPDGVYEEWRKFRDGEWVRVAPGQSGPAPAAPNIRDISFSRSVLRALGSPFMGWRKNNAGRWTKDPR